MSLVDIDAPKVWNYFGSIVLIIWQSLLSLPVLNSMNCSLSFLKMLDPESYNIVVEVILTGIFVYLYEFTLKFRWGYFVQVFTLNLPCVYRFCALGRVGTNALDRCSKLVIILLSYVFNFNRIIRKSIFLKFITS